MTFKGEVTGVAEVFQDSDTIQEQGVHITTQMEKELDDFKKQVLADTSKFIEQYLGGPQEFRAPKVDRKSAGEKGAHPEETTSEMDYSYLRQADREMIEKEIAQKRIRDQAEYEQQQQVREIKQQHFISTPVARPKGQRTQGSSAVTWDMLDNIEQQLENSMQQLQEEQ